MRDIVKRVIQIIEKDLSLVPDLEEISKELNSSRFFLSRAFKEDIGESFTEYVKRRKLSEAAREISTTNRRILDIALEYGYGSEEAFNRSFKKLFRGTPKRAKFHHAQLFKKSALTISPKKEMKYRIEQFGGRKLRAIGAKFSYDKFGEINSFWKNFHEKYPHIEGDTFGLSLPLNEDATEEFYYLIAFEPRFEIDGSILIEIPLKNYVVFEHVGVAHDLMSSFNYIWGKWIYDHNDFEIDGMDFEMYPASYDPLEGSSVCYIYLPFQAL